MPVISPTLAIKAALAFLGRMAASIFAFLTSIPSKVYAILLALICLATVWHLVQTQTSLRHTQALLSQANGQVATLTESYRVCRAAVQEQAVRIIELRRLSDQVTDQANAELRAAAARARKAEARAAELRARPTPPPELQCEAAEALLNEALDAPL